jgi:homotetrameric cytidine deaminase
MTETYTLLIQAACEAREASYAPYSGFRVGAALLCADGRVVTGGNVENASLGLSICAERSAVVRAVAEGRRSFKAIAVCADGEHPTPPCGACRQVLLEFAPDCDVIIAGEDGPAGEIIRTTVRDLVPHAFADYPDKRRPHEGTEAP